MKINTQTAKFLGYAGLIPFVGLSAFKFLFPTSQQHEFVTFGLIAYAATIVSFLGAIHWGLAMNQNSPNSNLLLWGVAPSLLGWISLVLGSKIGLLLLVTTLFLCFAVDYKTYPKFGLEQWLPMRFILTTVASVSLILHII